MKTSYYRIIILVGILSLSACTSLPVAIGSAAVSAISNSVQASADKAGRDKALAQTYVNLGVEYMQQGQRELALSKLQHALELDPNSASAHNAIAILYAQLGQTDLAGQHYQQAVSLDPQDSGAHNNYGQFLCSHNELAKADEQFLLALKNPLYETPAFAYENAGLCALRVPDVAKAEQYFRSALQSNPKAATSLYQMALIQFNKQDYLSARAYLQRYSSSSKPNAQGLWLGIRVEQVLGDKNAESSYALALRSNFPDSEEAHRLAESQTQGSQPHN